MDSTLDRRRVLAAAGALALGGTGLGQPARGAASSIVITVPIQLSRQRIVSPLWIDKKGPFPFLLDTGSPYYAIDPTVAQRAGIPQTSSAWGMAGMTGGARRVDAYLGTEVVIGGALRSENVVFTASNLADDQTVGLIPRQVLMLRRTDLDPVGGEIRIYESGAPDLKGYERLHLVQASEWVNGAVLGGTGASTPDLVVDVMLDGAPLRLTVDTGAPSALTINPWGVHRHGLWDKYPKWTQGDGRGMYEAYRGRMVRASELRVGSTVLKGPPVHLIDPSESNLARATDGVIGLDTLRRFTMSIDFGQQALWLKPNATVDQPFRYNRSGIQLGRIDGRMGVAAVAPGSPAATAGLQPGDVILTPNGESGPVFQWSLYDAPGTVLEFAVRRDGAVKPVRLVLAELL
jgi:hypothetical protein